MRTYLDCLPCVMQQALQALRSTTKDEALVEEGLRKVALRLQQYNKSEAPPLIVRDVHRIVREVSRNNDPYRKIKAQSTAMALDMEPRAKKMIRACSNSFEMAVRFALAGNAMDYALMSVWDEGKLLQSIERVRSMALDSEAVECLRRKTLTVDWILFLGDNAGEAVFDRLLLEECLGPKMVYAVKSSPIINDATREDAIDAGIDSYAKIICNGSDAPGTVLDDCSEEFLNLFNNAPLVIAKGQANFETLNDAKREIFFLTQIKCPVIAQHYGYELGHWLVTSNRNLRQDHL